MFEHLGISWRITRDDRQARRHCLQRDQRKPLEAGRQQQQIGGGHQIGQIAAMTQ